MFKSSWVRALALAGMFVNQVWAQAPVDVNTCWSATDAQPTAQSAACQAHQGCSMILARSPTCAAAKLFLEKLAKAQDGHPVIENNAVFTAAIHVMRPIPALEIEIDKVHRLVQHNWRLPPQVPGVLRRSASGMAMYYEGQMQNGQIEGIGTLITAGGGMSRGNFIAGRLQGQGQISLPSGLFVSGSMWEGSLKGDGVIQFPSGAVIVGQMDGVVPDGFVTTHFPDGRSQKAFYNAPGKLLTAGPVAQPGQTAEDPDMNVAMASIKLSLDCMVKRPFAADARESLPVLRELLRGPCGADPDTIQALADAEKEAGLAASREVEQARQQAAARARAEAERAAMVTNFLGQVSSILGSYQNVQQSAAVSAAAAAALQRPAPAPAAAPPAARQEASASSASSSPMASGSDRTRRVHNPAADATSCVRMVQTSTSTVTRISGNFNFHNGCNSTVEVFWCFPKGGVCGGAGTVSIAAGRGWPVMDNEAHMQWGACRGANGGGFNPGNSGYTCHLLNW